MNICRLEKVGMSVGKSVERKGRDVCRSSCCDKVRNICCEEGNIYLLLSVGIFVVKKGKGYLL